jgi:muconolactone delta-isomerase
VQSLSKRMFTLLAPGLTVLMAGMLVSCDSSTNSEPQIVDESQLEFVPRSGTAPALETMDTSFWAVKGQDREVEIRYVGQEGPGTGKEFLELVIEEQTLLRRPDGSAFAEGDSIEIRVIVDPDLFLVRFEPSGLQFNPDEPAKMDLDYDEAEDAFLAREGEFGLWRQEQPGDPWERIGIVQVEELDELEALLTGFTRYALAVGR